MEKAQKNIILRMMATMSACMGPVIPVLVGCGVIKLAVLLLGMTGVFAHLGQTEALLTYLDTAPFYFLPMLVAYSSAKHFDCNPGFALASVAIMLYPDFAALMSADAGVSFLGIPVLKVSYSNGILPAIALIAVMKWVEVYANKWIPGPLKSTFVPTAVILVTGLLGILAVGPAISTVAGVISSAMGFLQTNYPVVAWAAMCCLLPVMIMTGTHFIFVTIMLEQLGSWGYEAGFHVSCFIMTLTVTGACLGVVLKSRGEVKKTALANAIPMITTGVSEPSLFGTLLPLRAPLYGAMIGGIAGGIWQGLHALHSYVFATPGIFAILMFASPDEPMNLLHVLIAAAIGGIVSLAATLVLYKQPKEN